VTLDELFSELEVEAVVGDPTVDVTAVTYDSRAVVPGALFCCLPGQVRDGHDFAPAAVAAGASALLVERPLDLGVTQVRVADARRAMAFAAAAFHGHPSRSLAVVGVTGTNGKTTVTALLHAALEAAGRPTGVIGTLTGARTTPEAPELQARLAEFRDRGDVAVAMEVSSHALALDRTEGTRFDVAVFTNLSRDHLDFHASMEDYFAAKARLFEPERSAAAVVNADDPHGRLLSDAARIPTRTYSLDDVTDLRVGVTSSTGTWRGHRLHVPFGGAYNVGNALAAATTAVELGVDVATALDGIAAAPPVPGRFEVVSEDPMVVVDYAHTPDGLEQLLRSVRAGAAGGRLLVVFGAGGDRDREKRPAMGEAVSRLADVAVVTSDNPRSEHPGAIVDAVAAGAAGPAELVREVDRRAAIALALRQAGPGDVVVVAGRGHEPQQDVGGQLVPFDDRTVVREELARLGQHGAP
jgi:UDP-N-acetylmuramoyl-L-alanyl-D-glutamate--2,6-diaminopimelate ligase